MLLTFFLILIDVCVCVPLNYLTCEKNGAIEMLHKKTIIWQERSVAEILDGRDRNNNAYDITVEKKKDDG